MERRRENGYGVGESMERRKGSCGQKEAAARLEACDKAVCPEEGSGWSTRCSPARARDSEQKEVTNELADEVHSEQGSSFHIMPSREHTQTILDEHRVQTSVSGSKKLM
eukprot:3382060-Rhodomonas_salina.2